MPATVSDVMSLLADHGVRCALFGGWAKELLGLRAPGPHRDIDLVHEGNDFSAVDRLLDASPDDLRQVREKRFHHKRAFLYRDVLCEILLVQSSGGVPFTWFWGDTRFVWHAPLLADAPVLIVGRAVDVVSPHNLLKYQHERPSIQPQRWSDPASLVP